MNILDWDEDALMNRAEADSGWGPPPLKPRMTCHSCGCAIWHPSFMREDPEMPGRPLCRPCFRGVRDLLLARLEKRENQRNRMKP